MINSIGLPNRGLDGYLEHDLPQLAQLPVPLITNVMGSTAAEVARLVEAVDARPEVAAIELNVSCPNVKTGLDIGADPASLAALVRAVRPLTRQAADRQAHAEHRRRRPRSRRRPRPRAPTPCRSSTRCARWRSTRVGGTPWLGGRTGGLSGPAIRSVALAQVSAVALRVRVPVVGMGGVAHGIHANDLISVGAALVAVGTENFRDPCAGSRIAHELKSLQIAGSVLDHRRTCLNLNLRSN